MAETPTPDFEGYVLGQTSETVHVGTSDETRRAAVSMAKQTRRTLDIVSRNLDAPVYDNEEFIGAVRRLVVNSPRARVRILVQDIAPIVTRGHRLLELSRQLSSYMQIRIPAKEHAHYNFACLLADVTGTMHRLLADRYDGTVNFNDPAHARDLTHFFDGVWETAETDRNLRRL